MLPVVGNNPLPDEKGTESLEPFDRLVLRFDVTILYPMKRGLKGNRP